MRKLNLLRVCFILFLLILLLDLPLLVLSGGSCTCEAGDEDSSTNKKRDRSNALKFKIGAVVSILFFGALGVCLPVLAKAIPAFRPENDVFFVIKAFAAGVILATGFIHVLPDAFENLTSPCLDEHPWGKFSFTGFVAMLTSIGTLMVDTFATSYYQKRSSSQFMTKAHDHVDGDEARVVRGISDAHHEGHTAHVHAHGSAFASDELSSMELIRHRVISQVLELGIIVHSVIIGVALGASADPAEVRDLLVALSFHQFFEGIGLGGCISQAKFKSKSIIVMALFFALTTPSGIAIGIGITKRYDENSPTALIVEGIFNAASAGILIYMALVDLLAADFMSVRIQSNGKLQMGASLSLLVGAGCMSVLAIWA